GGGGVGVGSFVEPLAWIAARRAILEIGLDEVGILERALDVAAHRELPAAARIGLERGADVGGELIERIAAGERFGHRFLHLAASWRKIIAFARRVRVAWRI